MKPIKIFLTFLTLPLFLFSQQASSSNYVLLDYGLFNGNLNGTVKPASDNYTAVNSIVGGMSGNFMTGNSFSNDPGYYLGPFPDDILAPENVIISVSDNTITISWDPVNNAASYRIYSSDHPYNNFSLDNSGSFDGTSWSAPHSNEKRFYFVKSVDH